MKQPIVMKETDMNNEERIYRLCEYVIDLIDEILRREDDYYFNANLEYIKYEIKSIREDIDNN